MGQPSAYPESVFRSSKISQLLEEIQQLHQRLSDLHRDAQVLVPLPVLDSKWISDTIVNSLPLDIAPLVVKAFLQDLQLRDARITAIRATVVYAISGNESPWSILEWIENNNTEAMAIYQIADSGFCGYLMHLNVFLPSSETADIRPSRCLQHCFVNWKIANITQLKTLFGGVRHLMELLTWSVDDLCRLYCENQLQDCSEERYPGILSAFSSAKFEAESLFSTSF